VIELYGINKDQFLYYDIEMLKLVRVEDLYKDQTSFLKTLVKGVGTASPYSDCQILRKYPPLSCFIELDCLLK